MAIRLPWKDLVFPKSALQSTLNPANIRNSHVYAVPQNPVFNVLFALKRHWSVRVLLLLEHSAPRGHSAWPILFFSTTSFFHARKIRGPLELKGKFNGSEL